MSPATASPPSPWGAGLEGDTAALAGGVLAGHGMMPFWRVALAAATGAGTFFGHGIELVLGDIIQAERRLTIPELLILAPWALFLWRRARHRKAGADWDITV